MKHITFNTPLPRIDIDGQSVEVAAVWAEVMPSPSKTSVTLDAVAVVLAPTAFRGERQGRLAVTITVAIGRQVSRVDARDPVAMGPVNAEWHTP